MVNYANGKIYKLVNNVDDEIYVGSTCNPLYKRKSGHKSASNSKTALPAYKHLTHVGWENVEIILIEDYGCKTKDELHRRERYWIDTLKPSLNKCLPWVSPEERKQHKKDYTKEYIQKPDVKTRKNQRNKVWMQSYTSKPENKERKVQYDKARNSLPDVKAKRVAGSRILIECDCGNVITKPKISRHKQSQQHKNWQKINDFIHS